MRTPGRERPPRTRSRGRLRHHLRDRLHPTDRAVLALAGPAFLALVSEPLFLLADAAVVGRLGAVPLAGLGIAGAVLTTVVGLCVFLAYGTTAGVARRLGAGDRRGALALGVDGLWLAALIGGLVTVVGVPLTRPVVDLLGAGPDVSAAAADYLRVAWLGTVPLLLVLAATGVLRGLLDVRTPLLVAVGSNVLNVALDLALVHGPGPFPRLELVGSAIGTVVAQGLGALVLTVAVVRAARREGASLRPDTTGIRAAARDGGPLVVRTLTLRAALLATTYAVVLAGRDDDPATAAAELAAHQLALTLWTALAFALDALAIAAQALTGRALGSGDAALARATTARVVRLGVLGGVLGGLGLAVASPVLGRLLTSDATTADLLLAPLLVAAVAQPLAGVVFVLDGVLIGAGDGRWLARAGLLVLVLHAPLVLVVGAWTGSLAAVWVVMTTVFMGARAGVLLHRSRGDGWLVVGAGPAPGGRPTLGP